MIRLAAALLLVGASPLVATLAWELGAFSAAEPVSVPHSRRAVAAPPAPVSDHTAEWVATILARPLFSPDRRPPSEAPAARASGAPAGLPRLAGVVVGPFGRSAIFVPEGSKPMVVTEGGRVDAWTVRSIEVGTVQVSGPGGARTLHPSFESSPAASAAPGPTGQSLGLARAR